MWPPNQYRNPLIPDFSGKVTPLPEPQKVISKTLSITDPNGNKFDMPWNQERDPTEQEIDSFIQSQPKSPSLIEKVWNKAWTPLTDIGSRTGKYLGDAITDPNRIAKESGDNSWKDTIAHTVNQARGFVAGAAEKTGEFADSLSSPGNLGLLAVGGIGGKFATAAKSAVPEIEETIQGLTRALAEARTSGKSGEVYRLGQELSKSIANKNALIGMASVDQAIEKGVGLGLMGESGYKGVKDQNPNQLLPFVMGASMVGGHSLPETSKFPGEIPKPPVPTTVPEYLIPNDPINSGYRFGDSNLPGGTVNTKAWPTGNIFPGQGSLPLGNDSPQTFKDYLTPASGRLLSAPEKLGEPVIPDYAKPDYAKVKEPFIAGQGTAAPNANYRSILGNDIPPDLAARLGDNLPVPSTYPEPYPELSPLTAKTGRLLPERSSIGPTRFLNSPSGMTADINRGLNEVNLIPPATTVEGIFSPKSEGRPQNFIKPEPIDVESTRLTPRDERQDMMDRYGSGNDVPPRIDINLDPREQPTQNRTELSPVESIKEKQLTPEPEKKVLNPEKQAIAENLQSAITENEKKGNSVEALKAVLGRFLKDEEGSIDFDAFKRKKTNDKLTNEKLENERKYNDGLTIDELRRLNFIDAEKQNGRITPEMQKEFFELNKKRGTVKNMGRIGDVQDIIDEQKPNKEFNDARQKMVDDIARMDEENKNRPRNIEEENKGEDWNRRQRNTARYEGTNINDVHTPLTPSQQIIRDSFLKIKEHSDKYNRWFSEQEEKLPKGEFFTPPPEIETKYKAEQKALYDAHDKLVNRLSPLEKESLPVIDVKPESAVKIIDLPNDSTIFNRKKFDEMAQHYENQITTKSGKESVEMMKEIEKEVQAERKLRQDIIDETAGVEKPVGRPQKTFTDELGKEIKLPDYIKKGEIPEGKKSNLRLVDRIKNEEGYLNVGDISKGVKDLGKDIKNRPLDYLNIPRAIKASMDLSFPLRQGLFLAHEPSYWKSFKPMFESAMNNEGYKTFERNIRQHKHYAQAVKDGVSFTDLDAIKTKGEEAFQSSVAHELPLGLGKIIERSDKAYSAFANSLRIGTYSDLINAAEAKGLKPKTNAALRKEIVNFVNTASGRGSLGKLAPAAEALNAVLFSPRLAFSRGRLLANIPGAISSALPMKADLFDRLPINAKKYVTTSRFARQQYLKSWVVATAGISSFVKLASLIPGVQVSTDPTNPDFMKIKIGRTRLDPWGGMQQYIVLGSQRLTSEKTSSITGKKTEVNSGKYGKPTHLENELKFIGSKASPLASAFIHHELGVGQDNKPFSYSKELWENIHPLISSDLYDIAKENPKLLPILGPLGMFGMGVQTYSEQPFGSKKSTNTKKYH